MEKELGASSSENSADTVDYLEEKGFNLMLDIRDQYLESHFGKWTVEEIEQTREDINKTNAEIEILRRSLSRSSERSHI